MRNLTERTFFVGDLHGKKDHLLMLIKEYNIRDSNIIILGDCGVGFCNYPVRKDYAFLNKHLELRNNKLYYIRGNHDNPKYWYDEEFRNEIEKTYSNIIHLLDGEIIEIFSKKYLIIGGGISIDRFMRKEGISYWEEEYIRYPQINEIENLEGILSHVGPIPVSSHKNNLFYWYNHDAELPEDINEERTLIDKIARNFHPREWYFGHFHLNENFDYIPENSEYTIRCHCLNELSFSEVPQTLSEEK